MARRLVEAAEAWFRERGVTVAELSYLAKNEAASAAWGKLGYEPFRVFMYKRL